MTNELEFIRDEIYALNEHWADIVMLNSLANNIVFSLGKLEKSEQFEQLTARQKQNVSDTISDVLNTISKELKWTMELVDTDPEQVVWYRKTKHQLLEDIQKLFANG